MKRFGWFMVILAVFLALAVFWRGVSGGTTVVLQNGIHLSLVDTVTGPYAEPTPPWQWRKEFAAKLPRGWGDLLYNPQYGTGSGRSWHHISDEKAMHLWFAPRREGVPVRFTGNDYEVVVADDQGWLYEPSGNGHKGYGFYSTDELYSFSFTHLPRWQKRLHLRIYTKNHASFLGEMEIPNPCFVESSESWTTAPIPQTITTNKVRFILLGLESNPHWKNKRMEASPWQFPPTQSVRCVGVEPDSTSNAWHVVQSSFYDNFGNACWSALPPHRGPEDPSPRTQWKVEVRLCADHRSQTATNFFWKLRNITIPPPGKAEVFNQENEVAGLDIQTTLVSLTGAGTSRYTNGTLAELTPPYSGISKFSSSSSRTTDPDGKPLFSNRFESSNPHFAVRIQHADSGYYYSLRVIRRKTDKEFYLSGYIAPRPDARFHSIWEEDFLGVGRLDGLESGESVDLILGLHQPVTVTFLIDQPVQTPGKVVALRQGM